YETHVKGFTQLNSAIPEPLRGTFEGMGHKASVDLGTILGREPEGFDQRGGFFDAVTQDPVLAKLKLIGEPWDIG
ncbi:hypothetical protein, partial [Salmonella enterica]|uniref:hypothetical protein n=1 Tax=Salmonella enterica TaxID=28901 RepID=UPI0011BA67D4